MTEQPSTSRRSVALAATFLVIAVAAFAAAFYLLGGEAYMQPLVEQVMALVSTGPTEDLDAARTSPANPKLILPAGMPEEFALRLWQEQIDSQPMIEQLVGGEIRSLKIDKVEKNGDEAKLRVTVKMEDGTSAPGTIGFKKFGRNWYVAHATRQPEAEGGASLEQTGLPALDEVDPLLLSTMLAEQVKSQSVIQEYLAGIVKEVVIEGVQPGPKTVTIGVEMDETHGDGYASLVAIRGETQPAAWFIARFNKIGDESTATAQ